MTLSLEIGSVMDVAPGGTGSAPVQSPSAVERQTMRYPVPAGVPAPGSQLSMVLLSRLRVSTFTAAGGGGAEARVARVAAFRRATLAT